MPGKLLSDHYIQRMNEARLAQDRMEQTKARAEQTISERKETERRLERQKERFEQPSGENRPQA